MSARSAPNDIFNSRTGENIYNIQKGKSGPAAFAELIANHVLSLKDAFEANYFRNELIRAWSDQYFELSRSIKIPTILFYFSHREPAYEVSLESVRAFGGLFPQYVDMNAILTIAPYFDDTVLCASSKGSPHSIIRNGERIALDMGGGRKVMENSYYPSPEMHVEAANRLIPRINSLISEQNLSCRDRPIIRLRTPIVKSSLEVQPNFMIIGAAKSGTSAIANQLRRHPEIFIPPVKEVHFFDRFSNTPTNDSPEYINYLSCFSGGKGFKFRGEATVSYTMYPIVNSVPKHMRILLGDIPLFYIVREPVARIISQYRHGFREGKIKDSFNSWIMSDHALNGAIIRSNYLLQIQRYEEFFSRGNLTILFYEDYCNDYLSTLAIILRRLGANPDMANRIPNKIINKTSEASVPIPEISIDSLHYLRSLLLGDTLKFLSLFRPPSVRWPTTIDDNKNLPKLIAS